MTWTTFPVYPISPDGTCGCGDPECPPRNAGKHPQVTGWNELAAGEQFAPNEDGGYGIVTGTKSGIFVIDVDSEDALRYFIATYNPPETLIVKTGRGWQFYFEQPDFPVKSTSSKLAPKIDVRGENGFVLGPGSPHRSGKKYAIELERPIAPAPLLLLDDLRKQGPASREPGKNAPVPVDVESEEGQRRIALAKKYLAEAPPAVQGSGGSKALWDVSLYLVRRLELPLETCQELVGSLYNPRCQPAWSEREILHKLEDARDRSDLPCGLPPETWEKTVNDLCKPKALATGPASERKGYTFDPTNAVPASERRKVGLTDLVQCFSRNPEWAGVWRWDEFRQRIVAVNPPVKLDAEDIWKGVTEADITALRIWLEAHGVTAGDKEVFAAVSLASKARSFHPIKDYLAGLEPCPGILDDLAARLFGATDELSNTFLKLFLVGAVRRIRDPGHKFDTILLLYSLRQGVGKSSFVQALFGTEWCKSQMPELHNKDASAGLQGFWGVELSEMSRIVREETEAVKDFLSRTYDDFRPPYGRCSVRAPRQVVFVGTTNDHDCLRDTTGNRRYWPIDVKKALDLDWIEEHRDQIWGEAAALEATGASVKLDETWWEAQENLTKEFVQEDPWKDLVLDYVSGKEWVGSCTEIYLNKIDQTGLSRLSKRETNRIGGILRMLGCKPAKRRVGDKYEKGWLISDEIKSRPPSKEEAIKQARALLAKN